MTMNSKIVGATINFMKCRAQFSKTQDCCRIYHSCHAIKNLTSVSNKTKQLRYCSESLSKCWNCKFPYKSELFCSKCKSLQEMPEDLTYFDIIGVKKDFDVDKDDLQRKYRQMQNRLHPDKFSNTTEEEKQISEKLSSLINKAYYTLSHPLQRGIYLLKLNNISLPESTTNVDPEFLMDILEKNEEIETASKDEKTAIKLIVENRKTLADLTKNVSEAFKRQDNETAKQLLIKMRYYTSIENRLKKIKQDIGIVE